MIFESVSCQINRQVPRPSHWVRWPVRYPSFLGGSFYHDEIFYHVSIRLLAKTRYSYDLFPACQVCLNSLEFLVHETSSPCNFLSAWWSSSLTEEFITALVCCRREVSSLVPFGTDDSQKIPCNWHAGLAKTRRRFAAPTWSNSLRQNAPSQEFQFPHKSYHKCKYFRCRGGEPEFFI